MDSMSGTSDYTNLRIETESEPYISYVKLKELKAFGEGSSFWCKFFLIVISDFFT